MRIVLFLLSFVAVSASAQDLSARMGKILKAHGIPTGDVGLAVIDLGKDGHPLEYGLHENNDLIPASVTKIAVASAVLAKLGPSFKFQTTLWTNGTVKGDTLKGDLILKGGGDAGFVSESMWFLVNEFTRTGIRKIEGNVIVDDSDFDTVRADPSRDPVRVDRAYDAPVGAMSFNWNSINIFVRPTAVGEAPRVHLDPIPAGFTVVNRAKTVNKGGSKLDVSREGARIVVRGSIGLSANEAVVYKNIDDPVDWSGRNLIFFLEQRGISVSGKVRSGKKPDGAKLAAKAESKPVSQHVADMMKFSNNYVAEMLAKNLAAQSGKVPATIEDGMKIVREHLTSLGVDEKRYTLVNPSGLSRRNRLKAADLARVLARAQENFPTFAEMLASFPLGGQDGTLRNRMKSRPGWVRAKTGLLTGVVGLAGYSGRQDGSMRAFAFIYNGKPERGESVRALFDALALELIQ